MPRDRPGNEGYKRAFTWACGRRRAGAERHGFHWRYPEERVYSEFGELVELHTFRGGTGWSGGTWPTNTCGSFDKTTWIYDGPSGLLAGKRDNSNSGASYAYTNGMLFTRSWARTAGGAAITSTNTYNEFGDLAQIDYSDSTPSVAFSDFNRLGLPRQISDAAGTNILSYDHAGRLTLATNIDGLLAGIAVSNRFVDGVKPCIFDSGLTPGLECLVVNKSEWSTSGPTEYRILLVRPFPAGLESSLRAVLSTIK